MATQAQPTKQQMQDEVIYGNRVEYLKSEHDRLLKAKDQLHAEISKKTSDFELYMGQKDAESKKLRADALASQEQLSRDKEEFQAILQSFQKEKETFEAEKQALESEKRKVAGQMESIGHFIQAVRRDISVLGL